jgi:tetratricopeptide (TPR) repeat protein
MRRLVTLLCVCLVAAISAVVFWRSSSGPLTLAGADRLLEIAIADADNGRTDLAYEYLDRILKDCPDHQRARVIKATMSINLRRPAEAAEAIAGISDEHLASTFEDSWALAKFMTNFGFLYEAEPLMKRLLLIKPDHPAVRKELVRCYRLSGENAAAAEYLAAALRQPKVELRDLLMATAPLTNWADAADVDFMKRVGQKNFDPLTMLGYARREMQTGHLPMAVQVLKQILAKHPSWQPALSQLAIANWQLGREDDWRQAMSQWDPATLDHADAWFIWGVWQLQHDEFATAVRCFGEALRRAPKHAGAATQLIAALKSLGLEAEAVGWTEYVERLTQLDHVCLSIGTTHQDPESVRVVARGCEDIGWPDEAQAWYRFARLHWPDNAWPEQPADGAAPPASLGEKPGLPHQWLVSMLEDSRYPLPKPFSQLPKTEVSSNLAASGAATWRLDDEAARMGIRFRFQNGLKPDRKQAYMFEFSGPGIGVLDYDGDGWPDLHLTQGAPWPVQEGDTSQRDELFRNLGDGTFASVTEAAGIGEPGYSQGPAVGDLNGDGFPDVYVCNIGSDRCYRNNGDGTFTDVTAETGTAGEEWSLSAAWADLNEDGLPDLYVANYLAGDVLEHACVSKDGRRIQCEPTFFPGADDRLYLNLGDGTFQDISAAAGILIPGGKGMGIVVGRFQDSSRKTGIFLANDMTPNFLFVRSEESSTIPQFENVGAIAGVAFGPQGTAQSSMGVAAGDVNGDGRVDLFVTNFLSETPNLFLQGPDGGFEDVANQYGLTTGGLLTEGWGAQFLDVDADGHVDLFVANGHLEEYDPERDRMPSQLFRNLDGRKLELVSGPGLGRYFAKEYLGRGVAVWDWNGDGREDVVVSHVSDPVAVLTNRTEAIGHRLGLRLVGVRSAREPVGTQVKLNSGGRTLVREQVAGDGYTATNERRLSFGLGASTDPVDVEVDWAGGTVQRYSGLEVDVEYVLIEGRSDAVPLRRYAAHGPP